MNNFSIHARCVVMAALACLLFSTINTIAQGTLLFDTMQVGARVYDSECEPLSGDGFVAQLYVSSDATGNFQPVGEPVPFGEGDAAGYVQGGTVVVPFIPALGSAWVQMRIWDSMFPSYEQALESGLSMVGQTSVIAIFLGVDEYPSELFGMETLRGGCVSEVRLLETRVHEETVELRWSKQHLSSWSVVVPQEANTPLGPWRDIDGDWNPANGIASPPSSFHIPKSGGVRFYRMRIGSNIGGLLESGTN